ncbi:hypothetical protein TNIN_304211 [Trichonephila inaurata madagascariensis]|uniref:Uncharacterized protein n=1 Tax=Trichonephila inaurata madagascariensis TaxID=2747483 RepID=A0A8X7CE09_9ARAC|nr:hypothetical protein TNIN_304211 [Trichonephila inaurata madagascariensis]
MVQDYNPSSVRLSFNDHVFLAFPFLVFPGSVSSGLVSPVVARSSSVYSGPAARSRVYRSTCCQDVGLVIKVAKYQFLQTEVDFLGHHISVNGIEPSKERIKVMEDFQLPETVKELRRHLGVINFYHRFIPNAA